MKNYLAVTLVFVSFLMSAQTTLNQYETVIVPSKFEFLKQPDQYWLNTLTQSSLEKYGFKTLFDNDTIAPQSIAISGRGCEKLYADVKESGNFIMTKMQLILKDCHDKIVYKSAIGKSKEKITRIAYNEALSEALRSLETVNYHYTPAAVAEKPKAVAAKTEVVAQGTHDDAGPTLYAQPTANGYQLIDTTPKVIMKIFKTSNPNMFTATKENHSGVLLLKDNQWFFEYYQNEQLISEKVNVKF